MADFLLPLKRFVNTIRYRSEPIEFKGSGRRFIIKCPVPPDAPRESWGDFHYAVALAKALHRKGNYVRVDLLAHWYEDIRPLDTNIVLRGLSPFRISGSTLTECVNIMWAISHPSKITPEERSKYDHVFSAGIMLGAELLMQASDPERFNLSVKSGTPLDRPLFVGNARKGTRPVVEDCYRAGIPIHIIGAGWDDTRYRNWLIRPRISNEELPSWYAAAPIVLNDHEQDMQQHSFLSNRAFDSLSVGTPVCQPFMAQWLNDLFGQGLRQYTSLWELSNILRTVRSPVIPGKYPSLSMHDRARVIYKKSEDLYHKKFLVKYNQHAVA